MSNDALICENCGAPAGPDDRFCGECGTEILRCVPQDPEEDTDRDYATTLHEGFKGIFLEQDDLQSVSAKKAVFARATEIDPERPEAFVGLGLCFSTLGDDENALINIEQALKNGFGTDPRYDRILFEFTPEDDDEIEFEIGLPLLTLYRANMLVNLDQPELASRELDRIYETIPEEYTAEKLTLRAEIAFKTGDFTRAWDTNEQALAYDPECSAAYLLKGQLLLEKNDHGEAIYALSQSLEFDPVSGKALITRAKAFWLIGAVDLAKDDVEDVRDMISDGYSAEAVEPELGELTLSDDGHYLGWDETVQAALLPK